MAPPVMAYVRRKDDDAGGLSDLRSCVRDSDPLDGALEKSVEAELESLLSTDDEAGHEAENQDEYYDDDYDPDYERSIWIEFPPIVRNITGCAGIDMSIRDILKYLISTNSDDKHGLTEIMDDFYDGSSNDDYGWDTESQSVFGDFFEENAMARVAHASTKSLRDANREAIEAERAERSSTISDFRAKYAASYAEIKLKNANRVSMCDEFDLGWEELVVERGTWGVDADVKEANARQNLSAIYEKLREATHEIWALEREINSAAAERHKEVWEAKHI